jgi:hypothetical protein
MPTKSVLVSYLIMRLAVRETDIKRGPTIPDSMVYLDGHMRKLFANHEPTSDFVGGERIIGAKRAPHVKRFNNSRPSSMALFPRTPTWSRIARSSASVTACAPRDSNRYPLDAGAITIVPPASSPR